MPRASEKTGTTISATTAGRIPLKAASITGLCRIPAKKIATMRMIRNDGRVAPSEAATAPFRPRTL